MSEVPLVTLHGLGRTRLAMWPLGRRLGKLGYTVTNIGYFGPLGLRHSVDAVGDAIAARGLHDQPIDLVTHSMGGIVARALLAEGRIRARRMVQLAPPNQGSWLADRVRQIPIACYLPAFRDLGQGTEAQIVALGDVPEEVEVGVVAGESVSALLGGEVGDGVVRIAETYLTGARDWIVLPHFHTVVMNGRDTLDEVDHFLKNGRFSLAAERLARDEQGNVSRAQPKEQVAQ
ncbi:MAG: alpha/beta fold hydrolase [Planctomycetes bacterium]|nr:alpha/beta fold hydrolase [Planctomycetota bacterium]